jgi:hypothetical protein
MQPFSAFAQNEPNPTDFHVDVLVSAALSAGVPGQAVAIATSQGAPGKNNNRSAVGNPAPSAM